MAEGLDAGVPFEMGHEALRTVFGATWRVFAAHFFGEVDPGWCAEVLRAFDALNLSRWVRLAPTDVQVGASATLDLLHARVLLERELDVRLPAVERLHRTHPLPMPNSATCALMRDARDLEEGERHLRLARGVLEYSENVVDLEIAHRARLGHYVWLAEHFEAADGDERRLLLQIDALNRELTEMVGAEYAAQKAGFLDFAGKRAQKEQQVDLKGMLARVSGGFGGAPMVKAYRQYVNGRILAVTGDFGKAVKAVRKARNAGFSPEDAGCFLAFLLGMRNKNDEACAMAREVAQELRFSRGNARRDHPLARIYRDAGGSPADLGVDPEATWSSAIRDNGARFLGLAARLDKPRAEAIAEFWTQRRAEAIDMVLGALHPEDFDGAVAGNSAAGAATARIAHLSAARAAACHLDEIPDLAPLDRALLIAAAEEGVSGTALAANALEYLQREESAGRKLASLIDACPAYGQSKAIARARMRAHLAKGALEPADAELRAMVDRHADRTLVLELYRPVGDALRAAERPDDAYALGVWIADALGEPPVPPLRAQIVDHALAAISGRSAAQRAEWFERAARAASGYDELEIRVLESARRENAAMMASSPGDAAHIAERLANVWKSPRATDARALARDALLEDLGRRRPNGAARETFERLLRIAPEDSGPAVREACVEWYANAAAGLAGNDDAFEDAADLGQWLAPRLGGAAGGRTRGIANDLWIGLANRAPRPADRIRHLQTLVDANPDEPTFAARLAAERRGSMLRQVKLVGAAIATIAAVAGLAMLL